MGHMSHNLERVTAIAKNVGSTVRAVGLFVFGGPNVLRIVDIPAPSPAPYDVIVSVRAATVNPSDTLLRLGRQADLMRGTLPYVPGLEFAGVVQGFGTEGVQDGRLRIGDRVMGIVDPRRPNGGAQSELVAVPAASVVGIPGSTGFAEAATIPMNGLTAMLAVEALGLCDGATVLITGGAGAVGGYAISLAKRAGLSVVADGKMEDADTLRHLGADHVVRRGESMESDIRRLFRAGVDGLIDGALLGPTADRVIRNGGTVVALRRGAKRDEPRLQCRTVSVTDHVEDTARLQRLARLTASGVLKIRVAKRLPMSHVADAHRMLERGGIRGRIVLELGRDDARTGTAINIQGPAHIIRMGALPQGQLAASPAPDPT